MTTVSQTPPTPDNAGRRGRPYSLRLSEEERAELNRRASEARAHMPYEYGNGRLHGSVGHFLVWAAMQWKPPAPAAAPRARRAGSTRRPARRSTRSAPKRKAAKKGARR